MDVGTSAGAASAGLNPEAVAQHARDELLMHIAAASIFEPKRKNWQARRAQIAKDFDILDSGPRCERSCGQFCIAGRHRLQTYRLFDEKGQARADIAQHIWRATFFP